MRRRLAVILLALLCGCSTGKACTDFQAGLDEVLSGREYEEEA